MWDEAGHERERTSVRAELPGPNDGLLQELLRVTEERLDLVRGEGHGHRLFGVIARNSGAHPFDLLAPGGLGELYGKACDRRPEQDHGEVGGCQLLLWAVQDIVHVALEV